MEGSQDKTDGKIEVKIIYNFEKYFYLVMVLKLPARSEAMVMKLMFQ